MASAVSANNYGGYFKGKRALVTGTARGIGKDIAVRLSDLGAEVYALSYSAEGLDKLKKEYPKLNTVQVDLADWNATASVISSLPPLDLLVNNAGVYIPQTLLNSDEKTMDKIFNVNVKAPVNVTRIVAKSMIDRKCAGAIVNISSIAGQMAYTEHMAYCASKAALDAITRNMALELGPHKIRVNGVSPTVTLTDMGRQGWSDPKKADPMMARIPLHRFAEVKEVVDATIFLLSDQASYINGAHLPVDGGLLVT